MQSELSVNATPSLVILSTAYFPPICYFALIAQKGKVVIDLHETYSKQTWRNRCTILGGNGKLDLSIPAEKPSGNHTATKNILLSNHLHWNKIHMRSIVSAYNNAPFFIYYRDLVEHLVLDNQFKLLWELNHKIMSQLLKELELPNEIEYAEEFLHHPDPGNNLDMRFSLSPKNKVLATTVAKTFPPYYQVFEDRFGFQPNLSILDLLFNLGPDASNYLKNLAAWQP